MKRIIIETSVDFINRIEELLKFDGEVIMNTTL